MTVRLRLGICYDGGGFSGWAVQPGRRTVAGVIGDALTTLFRRPVPMVVAGRTDAGVHASGQVAHIDVDCGALTALTPRDRGAQLGAGIRDGITDAGRGAAPGDSPYRAALVGLRRRLAGLLPPDVRVPQVGLAPPGFDARFGALRRHYRYRIISSDWGIPPLRRTDVLRWRKPLDAPAMQEAAAPLIGLHDFAAYCKPRDGGTTIRDLQHLTVAARPLSLDPGDDGGASELEIVVMADAFCHSMVRSIVGALLAVGDGRFPASRPAELLSARERTSAIAVAPARGLTLMEVQYPPDDELAARATQTRAVRTDPCVGC